MRSPKFKEIWLNSAWDHYSYMALYQKQWVRYSRGDYQLRSIVRIAVWFGLVAVIFFLAQNINWVGDHYCFGSITKCYGIGG